MTESTWQAERARLAATMRHHPEDHDAIGNVRRDLRVERLADRIRETVDAAPPLTDEQKRRLRTLLLADDTLPSANR